MSGICFSRALLIHSVVQWRTFPTLSRKKTNNLGFTQMYFSLFSHCISIISRSQRFRSVRGQERQEVLCTWDRKLFYSQLELGMWKGSDARKTVCSQDHFLHWQWKQSYVGREKTRTNHMIKSQFHQIVSYLHYRRDNSTKNESCHHLLTKIF